MCEGLPIGSKSTVSEGFSGKTFCVQASKEGFPVNLCGCQEPVPRVFCSKYMVNTEEQQHNGLAQVELSDCFVFRNKKGDLRAGRKGKFLFCTLSSFHHVHTCQEKHSILWDKNKKN